MRTLAIALLAATTGCGAASQLPASPSPSSSSASPAPIIVALGDSLTAGPGLQPDETYPSVLERLVAGAGYPHRVLNAGVSGDTATGAARRLDAALVPSTRILIVAIGINDGLRGVPVATLEANLSKIVDQAVSRGIEVLLCQMEAPPRGSLQYTLAFHGVYTKLAARYRIPRVPFFLLDVLGNPDLNLPDRIHPNAAGAQLIAERVWSYLEPLLAAGKGRLNPSIGSR